MLRRLIATGFALFWLGSSSGVQAAPPRDSVCRGVCAAATSAAPSVRDAMTEGFARIALRAASPHRDAPVSRQDLLGLYVLLSLNRGTKQAAR